MRVLARSLASAPGRGDGAAPVISPPRLGLMQVVSVLYILLLVACGGQGCSGCGAGAQNIPGGFPIAERKENVVQIRAAKGLFDFLGANAAKLLGGVIPAGGIPIPSDCNGNPKICCNKTCNVAIGLTGMRFDPVPPQTTKLTVRTTLKTNTGLPVEYKSGIINIKCDLSVDTGRKSPGDVGITANLNTAVNATTRLTSLSIDPNSVDILDLQDGDIDINGNFSCDVLDFFKGLFLGTLKDQLKKQLGGPLGSALDGALCQKCMDAKIDCPQFGGVACNASKVCAIGASCIQRIGIEQRIDASGLLAGFSAGTPGNLDIYAVAGGYATVEANGVGGMSLGMLGGAKGTPASACVPARPAPGAAAPAPSPVYKGNTAPNGKSYHLGVGISTLELDMLGHGFYTTGGLCLRVGTAQVAQLASGTLGVLLPSLADLTRGVASSVQIVLKPQQPPTFTLGKGTYKTDGAGKRVIDDPLLKIAVKDLAIDFYLWMDDRNVRFMRLTTDMTLPIGLDVDNMNRIVPLLGDLGDALGNLRITDTALLKEDPAMLKALLPRLLPALLGSVAGSLSPIALPDLMGFALKTVQITSTPGADNSLTFLGLFLELALAQAAQAPTPEAALAQSNNLISDAQSLAPQPLASAETQISLASLTVPRMARYGLAAGARAERPTALLRVDASHPQGGSLEWQYRVDQGLWRPFDTLRQIPVDDEALLIPGAHAIEVRSRVIGAPETLDVTPARVEFLVSPATDDVAAASALTPGRGEGAAAAAGCSYAGPRGAAAGASALSVLGLLFLCALASARRPLRARLWVLGLLGASSLAASCKGDEVAAGGSAAFRDDDEIGRYLSAASKDGVIYLSAYNSTTGDLAFAAVKDTEAAIPWEVVDGLPEGTPDDMTPGAKRLGFTEAGPDVGRYTSLAIGSSGQIVIAYQDVSNNAVKLAVLPSVAERKWSVSTIAAPEAGARLGMFTQLTLDGSDTATVAFRAEAIQKMDGRVVSQLVVARAGSAAPGGPGDWTQTVVDEADMNCAGLCGLGKSCVAKTVMMKTSYACTAASGTCNPGCSKTQLCVAGACQEILAPQPLGAADGTGLYTRMVANGGSGAALFFNRTEGALKLAQGPEWKPVVVDGGSGAAVGAHPGAVMAADGTMHIAYQDTQSDRVLYRSWKDGKGGKVEIADDGNRGQAPAREVHVVGAGAVVFLDASGAPQAVYQDQTAGTLELAQRASTGTWTVSTKATGNTRSRGYYPQVLKQGERLLVLDVQYDRTREAPLSNVAFTALQ